MLQTGLRRDADLRPRHHARCPGRALPGDGARRVRRAVRHRRPAAGGRRLRRRHPARRRPSQPRRRSTRSPTGVARPRRAGRCCSGARATRSSPTRYLRDLLEPAAARRRAPVRGRLAPGDRGRARRRRRRLAPGSRDLERRRPRAGDQPGPAAGGGARCGPALDRARRRPTTPRRVVELGGTRAAACRFARLDRRVARPRRRAGRDRGAPGRPGRAAGAARRRPDRRASTPAGGPARSIVVADAGLGLRGMGRALRGAGPDHVIGDRRRAAGRGPRHAGARAPASPPAPWTPRRARALGARPRPGRPGPARAAAATCPAPPAADAEGAVRLHLRRDRAGQGRGLPAPPGAGPAATLLRDDLRRSPPTTGSSPRSRRSRSTARRSGIASAVPDMDVTAPGTLTAAALADAVGGRRRDRRLRLPGRAAQRASPPPASSTAGQRDALWPGPAADVGRRARSRLPLLRGVRELLPAGRAAHAVRHDRGAAGDRHLARRRSRPAGPRRRASASAGRCPGVERRGSARSTPPGRPTASLTDRPGVTGEICVRAAHVKDRYDPLWATEQAQPRDARLAPHRRRRPPRRRRPAVGRGPAGARRHHGRRAGHPGRRRAAGRGASPASRRPPSSASGRPAPSRSWSSSCPTGTGAPRRPRRRRPGRRGARGRRACRSRPCSSPQALPVDIRHDSKIDRAAVARWAARVLAGGRVGPPVRVLVTGASGMLGRGVAPRPGRPRRRRHRAAAAPAPGCALPRGARRRRRPGRRGRGPSPGRTPSSTWPPRSTSSAPWADYVRANVDGTRIGRRRPAAPPASAGWSTSPRRRWPTPAQSLVGAGAGPADPAPRPRPLRPDQGRWPSGSRSPRTAPDLAVVAVRPHLVWGPGDTQLVARIVDRARAGRLPLVGSGAALIDTHLRRQRRRRRSSPPLDRCEHAHGQALVVSNGEPRPVAELLAGDLPRRPACPARTAGCRAPSPGPPARPSTPCGRPAGAARRRPGDPPLTRFLAEQLATAHWFDQRRTREVLGWTPRVSLDEGWPRSPGRSPPAARFPGPAERRAAGRGAAGRGRTGRRTGSGPDLWRTAGRARVGA